MWIAPRVVHPPPEIEGGLVQSTLGEFQETKSDQPFALQNSKLLKVSLDQVTIQAKAGSMVAYQGDVAFEHAGSGGLSRMMKKAVSGEGTTLMKMSGTGEVFLGDTAQDITWCIWRTTRSRSTAGTCSRSTQESTGTSGASRAC